MTLPRLSLTSSFSTLRGRFMLVLLLVLAGLLMVYAVIAYKVTERAMLSWVDDRLATVAEDAVNMARELEAQRHQKGVSTDEPIELDVPGGFQVQIWYMAPDMYRLVARSSGAPTAALDPQARARPTNKPQTRTLRWQGRWWRVRTETRPWNQGRRWWIVQVAVDITPWRDRAPWIGWVLVASGIVLFGLFAIVLERLTRLLIWPMEQAGQLAQDIIHTKDLSRRLPADNMPVPEIRYWAEAFNTALDRLEQLFQQQRRFLADVSHELRTPLTIIRGQAQLMRRTGEYDPEAVADIEKEAERLARLVEDLLFLARAEAGALPLRQEAVDLDTVLLDVLRQTQMLAEAKQQRLELEHLEPLPVRGDPDRLTQAILNLVSNAIQYTPPGGTIHVGARREEQWAVVWVRDTGPGIPPEDLPHVFERFYRAARSRTRRGGGGAGLGLSIVWWIVDAHGGHITVQSKEGEGSTFTIYLPLDPDRVWEDDWDDEEDNGAENNHGPADST